MTTSVSHVGVVRFGVVVRLVLYSASERKVKRTGSQGDVRIYAKGLDRDFACA